MYSTEEIRQLKLPRLVSPYPLKQSVHYESLRDECDEWFLSYGLIEGEDRRHAYIESNFPYLTSVIFPSANRRRFRDLCQLAAGLTLRDDEVDRDREGGGLGLLRAHLTSTRSGFTSGEPRWEPLFADLWRSFEKYLPPQQLRRLTKSLEVYLEGCLEATGALRERATFATMDEYLRCRRKSIGHGIDHIMVEIGLGIELPPEVLSHPLFEELNLCDIDRVIVYQDILSCKKELATEQENIVAVIASIRRCSLQEAVTAAHERFESEMSRFDRAYKAIARSSLARNHDVLLYAEALHDFTAGLIEWTSRSARYTRERKSDWNHNAIRVMEGVAMRKAGGGP
jgi:hypothetical protein